MSGTTMVFLIVLVGVIGSILRARYTASGQIGQVSAPAIEDNRRMREEIGQLKDRIAVLERVITDNHKSVDLDREIDRLRDR